MKISILFGILLALLAPTLGAAQPTVSASADKPQDFTLRADEIRVEAEITQELKPVLGDSAKYAATTHDYEEVKAHYEKCAHTLAAQFPPGLIDSTPGISLQSFNGKLEPTSVTTHYAPYLPIVAEDVVSLPDLRFFKIKAKLPTGEVWGLRVEAPLEKTTHVLSSNALVNYTLYMAYTNTVNARALGFNFGRLIMSASNSVKPAPTFQYNGLHPWSEHNRYKKTDQISFPIKFTNHAHPAGSLYVISSHPDFALEALFTGEGPVVLTFFLWKGGGKLFFIDVPPAPQSMPDFIFQLVLHRAEQSKNS